MIFPSNRREFLKALLTGAVGLTLAAPRTRAAGPEGFRFLLLGDIHFDHPEHHDMEWLQRTKPDDVRQVKEYTRQTREILPRLFATLRQVIREAGPESAPPFAFAMQVGDLVEGLCGNAKLALQQDEDALRFLRGEDLGVPFLFTKGNHDITGPDAPEAFKEVFHPFLREQAGRVRSGVELSRACYAVEHGGALFCFFDAYDKESLPWLEAELARRTARHCFLVLHPPVVPYGARATWHIYSNDREKATRERFLELLGKHNVLVLGGHIHKYSLLVRTTSAGGRFLQVGLSSVISDPDASPQHVLQGVESYTPDQVKVEPDFSPATEKQRRAVYPLEAPFVKAFEYADVPGYAVLMVAGSQVTARVYSGVSRKLWRTLELTKLIES